MERLFLLLLFVSSVTAFLVNELFAIQGSIEVCAPCTEEGIRHMLARALTVLLVAVFAFDGYTRRCRAMYLRIPSIAIANKSNEFVA